eukprot:gene16245-19279_t
MPQPHFSVFCCRMVLYLALSLALQLATASYLDSSFEIIRDQPAAPSCQGLCEAQGRLSADDANVQMAVQALVGHLRGDVLAENVPAMVLDASLSVVPVYRVQFEGKTQRVYQAVVMGEVPASQLLIEEAHTESTAELFFSAYVEGSGSNKLLQLFNPSCSAIPLDGYAVNITKNGQVEEPLLLSGSLAEGALYTICYPNSEYEGHCDLTTSKISFNGDDALGLSKRGALLDCLGVLGNHEHWSVAGVARGLVDHTLVRKPEFARGNPDCSNPVEAGQLLSEAIEAPYVDTIELQCDVELMNRLPAVSRHLAVTGRCGNGAQCLVDGRGRVALFAVSAGGNLTLEDLCLANGYDEVGGAAVHLASGAAALAVRRSSITNHSAAQGVVFVEGPGVRIHIDDSLLEHNNGSVVATIEGGAGGFEVSLTASRIRGNNGTAVVLHGCGRLAFNTCDVARVSSAGSGAVAAVSQCAEGGAVNVANTWVGHNAAPKYGGVLNLQEFTAGTVQFLGSALQFNAAGKGGGVLGCYKCGGTNFTFTDVLSTNNSAGDDGGMMQLKIEEDASGAAAGWGSVAVVGSLLARNSAGRKGGAIFLERQQGLHISSSTLLENRCAIRHFDDTTRRTGGVVDMSYGKTLTVEARTLIKSNAAVEGGGLRFDGDVIHVVDCEFASNWVQNRGAAISNGACSTLFYCERVGGVLTVAHSRVHGSTSEGYSGSIYTVGSAVLVTHTHMHSNVVGEADVEYFPYGAAMHMDTAPISNTAWNPLCDVVIMDCVIENNVVLNAETDSIHQGYDDGYGGAVAVERGDFLGKTTISGSLWQSNAMGAFRTDNPVAVADAAFLDNEICPTAGAQGNGGAISFGRQIGRQSNEAMEKDISLQVTSSVFLRNRACKDGGAIFGGGSGGADWTRGGNLTVIGSEFVNNTADSTSGAVRWSGTERFYVDFSDCLFEANAAGHHTGPQRNGQQTDGGAMTIGEVHSGNNWPFLVVHVERCSFVANSALGNGGNGGALHVQATSHAHRTVVVCREQATSHAHRTVVVCREQ